MYQEYYLKQWEICNLNKSKDLSKLIYFVSTMFSAKKWKAMTDEKTGEFPVLTPAVNTAVSI